MDNPPIRDERILEALEARRSGSDDVADPQMAQLEAALAADPALADLYERLQATDAVLAAKFRDAPVPEGLAGRIGERLAADRLQRAAPVAKEEPARAMPVEIPVEMPVQPRRISRRRLAIGGGALTAAALLAVASISIFYTPPSYDAATVREDAVKFFNAELSGTQPRAEAFLLAAKSPPSGYLFSSSVVRVRGTRWREIRGLLDTDGVAYDVPGPGGVCATLYVVRCKTAGLPNLPSSRPESTTGGCFTSAWQSDGLVYVLVVRGSPQIYRQLVRLPNNVLT